MLSNNNARDGLPRYERPKEAPSQEMELDPDRAITPDGLEDALVSSALTEGGRALARGLVRVGGPALFGGGGVGLEYGSLLKTAVRPDYLGPHVREAAAYLRRERIDLLMVPGMSGYPVGAMYAFAADIPAILLKKERYHGDAAPRGYPAGAFVIPSYTGEDDVVMSADLVAMQDIVDGVLMRQVDAQRGREHLSLSLRIAGADDIIDKATMSRAVSDSALVLGDTAIRSFVARYRAATNDRRVEDVEIAVEMRAWVTPLIKGYNRAQTSLRQWFGIIPFAGLTVTGIRMDPPAIGIDGLGVVVFP